MSSHQESESESYSPEQVLAALPYLSDVEQAELAQALEDEERSAYERDALTIFDGTVWLTARMTPSYLELQRTSIYMRGKELASEATEALAETGIRFTVRIAILVHGRLGAFERAWRRRLPELPFPLRVEGTRFLYRTWRGDWEEHEEYSAALREFSKPETETAAQ